jgi:hypothetical protein
MLLHHLSPKGIGWKESQRPPELEITGIIDKYIYIFEWNKMGKVYCETQKGDCRYGIRWKDRRPYRAGSQVGQKD